eukprot:TRINITY_DN2348_c0_g2_i1.p1 TRINITY_DN2348_c0_g2~~TRINITY_DN2348_c0_g2_i1.p1  ORF type:complete len:588 (-),score=104.45 TRINITY_DN2348_c0_g2_i1:551-2314(-)
MPSLFHLRSLAHGSKEEPAKRTHDKTPSADGSSVQSKAYRFRSASGKVRPVPADEAPELLGVAIGEKGLSNVRELPKRLTTPVLPVVPAESLALDIGRHLIGSGGSNVSSGSEHEPDSVCLVAMVNEFLEDVAEVKSCGRVRCNCSTGTCSGMACFGAQDDDSDDDIMMGEVSRVLQTLTKVVGAFETKVLNDVTAIVKAAREDGNEGNGGIALCSAQTKNCSGGCLRRVVMGRLRSAGYNAAICKSRWDHSRGFPGGDYEYIDVINEAKSTAKGPERLLVDLDFRGQFQIARPLPAYEATLEAVPTVFVGHVERLKKLVNILSDATKRSLQRRSMHLPPWRKQDYMTAKWVAPYKRTTNEVPLSGHAAGCPASPSPSPAAGTLVSATSLELKTRNRAEMDLNDQKLTPASELLRELEGERQVDAVIFGGGVLAMGQIEERVRGGKLSELKAAMRQSSGFSNGSGELLGVESVVTAAEKERSEKRAAAVDQSIALAGASAAALSAASSSSESANHAPAWQPPSIKPRSRVRAGQGRTSSGLAGIFKEEKLAKKLTKQQQQQEAQGAAEGSFFQLANNPISQSVEGCS